MSSVSNVLAGGPPPGFGPPSTPPQPGSPLTQQAPPQAPPTYLDADYAPLQPEAEELDPFVLETPVKIRVLGSSRMLARPILAQQFQFLAPLILNGPILEQLALQGETFDMVEFFRLAQDATGLGKTYKFLKPLSPEQQQARSQPPPAVAAQLQKTQLDNQGRSQAVQSKERIETQRMQLEANLKQKEIDAADARHVLTVHQKETQAAQAAQQPAHQQALDILQGKQKLQQSQQEHQQRLQQASQQSQQKLQADALATHLKLLTQAREHAQGIQHAGQQHQQTLEHQEQNAVMSHSMTEASNRQDLAHTMLMNLMARQQKAHEVEQARKIALAKPRSPASSSK